MIRSTALYTLSYILAHLFRGSQTLSSDFSSCAIRYQEFLRRQRQLSRNMSTKRYVDIEPFKIYNANRTLKAISSTSATLVEVSDFHSLFLAPPRNRGFIGRISCMHGIDARLRSLGNAPRVAFHGLGGAGKSQLALEYAHRLKENESEISVFWIHGTSDRFVNDYLDIGAKAQEAGHTISLPSEAKGPDAFEARLSCIRNWLNSPDSGKWLMIIDNADDIDFFFEGKRLCRFIPDERGTIIFTTRCQRLAVRLATMSGLFHIGGLDQTDAKTLIYSLTGQISEDKSASELISRLEYLPLAISQAGSYIAENSHLSIAQYLEMYNENDRSKLDLLSKSYEDSASLLGTRVQPTAVTWQISFNQIQARNTLAIELLCLMGSVDRLNIPRKLLDCENKGSVEMNEALGTLCSYSLITATPVDGTFTMHRLVHLITRDWLRSKTQYKSSAVLALQRLSKQFPSEAESDKDQNGYLALCTSYLPHGIAVLENRHILSESHRARAKLAHKMSQYLMMTGRYKDAEFYAREAVELNSVQEKYTADDLDHLNQLARVYCWGSNLRKALAVSQRVKDNMTKICDNNPLKCLAYLNTLALILQEQGDYAGSESLHRQILQGREKILGPEHSKTIASMQNLALSFRSQKRYPEAEDMAFRAYTGLEQSLGPDHHHTIAAASNYGVMLFHRGEYDKAADIHHDALCRRERILGKAHPDTLKARENLATVLQGKENYAKSETLFREVVDGYNKALGPDHYDTLRAMANLTIILHYEKRYGDAENMCRKVLTQREKTLGREHPETVSSANHLATLIKIQADTAEEDAEGSTKNTMKISHKKDTSLPILSETESDENS